MKWKIDQTLTLRLKRQSRVALGTALLCLLTTLGAYAQSAGLTDLLTMQKQMQEYQAMSNSVDVSTPEGAELKAQLAEKINSLQIISQRMYNGLSSAEQMEFQTWANDAGASNGVPAITPALAERMNQLGISYNPAYVSNGSGTTVSTTTTGSPTNGLEVTIP